MSREPIVSPTTSEAVGAARSITASLLVATTVAAIPGIAETAVTATRQLTNGRLSAIQGAAGPQNRDHFKLVYLTTLDGNEDRLNDGAVSSSFIRVQRQMAGQLGGLRINAASEIASVRLAYSRAEMADDPTEASSRIAEALAESGEVPNDATALVYYDGPRMDIKGVNACGYADPSIALTVLDCGPLDPKSSRLDPMFGPTLTDAIVLHEVLHVLGAHHSADQADVMRPAVMPAAYYLDPGRDDYLKEGLAKAGSVRADIRLVGPASIEAVMAEAMQNQNVGEPVTGTQKIGDTFLRVHANGVVFASLNRPAHSSDPEPTATFMNHKDAKRHLNFLVSRPPAIRVEEFRAAAEHLVEVNKDSDAVYFGRSHGEPQQYQGGYKWKFDAVTLYGSHRGEVVPVGEPLAEHYEAMGGPSSLGWPSASHDGIDDTNPSRTNFEDGWIELSEETDVLQAYAWGRVQDCLSGVEGRKAVARPHLFVGGVCD